MAFKSPTPSLSLLFYPFHVVRWGHKTHADRTFFGYELIESTEPQDSVNAQKNVHLEELAKLTWSLEVFEIGSLSFPFYACKPRHTALNVRTQLPSFPETPVGKVLGSQVWLQTFLTGALETTIPSGPVLSTNKMFAWPLRSTCTSSSLERI